MRYIPLYESIIHEAVPRKAKQLGINPELPPDMNDPSTGEDPSPKPPEDVETPEEEQQGNGIDDDGGKDPNADEDPSVNNSGDMGIAPPTDEKEQAEQDLFKDLKPEQLEIKKKELRERYQDLYQIITDTIEKLNKVTKTSYDANMIDLSLRQLLNLKDLIHQSITKVFSTRTYVENKIELEKFATLFNSITTTIGMVYESRVKRASLDRSRVKYRNMNFDFHQDLGF